jgi:hypothetical protein
MWYRRNRDIALSYGLDEMGVRVAEGAGNFSLHHRV